MNARSIVYWTATALIAGETLAGGVTDLIRGREVVVAGRPVVDVVTQLGYPEYVLTILGTLKLAGAVAMFAPRLPRLKEWAYAGVVLELAGAAASHALRGNSAVDVAGCLILAAFALASWALRPPSRTLGANHAGTTDRRATPLSLVEAGSLMGDPEPRREPRGYEQKVHGAAMAAGGTVLKADTRLRHPHNRAVTQS